jgi:hypothetical protein
MVADDGVPICFVPYERMVEGTALVLDGTLHWLGVPVVF